MRTRHQNGYLYKKDGWWYVRFRDNVMLKDRSVERKHVAKRLARVCDQYRSKASVQSLAEEALKPVNTGTSTPQGSMMIRQFVSEHYLPFIEKRKRPSTCKGYKDIWKGHLEPRCGDDRLREFRTVQAQKLLDRIAEDHDLTRTSLQHIKSVLSAIFKHAKRLGFIHEHNPVADSAVPDGRQGNETGFYSLDDELRMLAVLTGTAADVVAVASFAGLRKGEIRGLRWEDYDGRFIHVNRSIWNRFEREPKTRMSKASVPVIAAMADRLNTLRTAQGNPTTGYIFCSRNGKPLNLDNLAARVVRPALELSGLPWLGWHAFRRGLATNLHQLGVKDKTLQLILRHSQISVTMNSYVKGTSAQTVEAMKVLDERCTKRALELQADAKTAVVN
jgi:integrase